MTDTGWFRGFQRSRTPANNTNSPISPSKSDTATGGEAMPAPSHDMLHQSQQQQKPQQLSPSKHRVTRPAFPQRVSSLLNLPIGGGTSGSGRDDSHRGGTAAVLAPLNVPAPSDNDDTFRDSYEWRGASAPPGQIPGRVSSLGRKESTWFNPNLMQMVETLQAVMMSKRDPLTPIPVKYNSYVLGLMEGFAHLTHQRLKTEHELDELRNLREKELEQFRGISEEWIHREDRYKAEIRRLEVVLAKKSKDGIASVALARHGSLVDRSGSKRFQARLKRLSSSQDHDGTSEWGAGEEQEKVDVNDSTTLLEKKPPTFQVTCNKTIGSMPRNTDDGNDVLMSRLVETRNRDNLRRLREQQLSGQRQGVPRSTKSPKGVKKRRKWSTHGANHQQPTNFDRESPDNSLDYPSRPHASLSLQQTLHTPALLGEQHLSSSDSTTASLDWVTKQHRSNKARTIHVDLRLEDSRVDPVYNHVTDEWVARRSGSRELGDFVRIQPVATPVVMNDDSYTRSPSHQPPVSHDKPEEHVQQVNRLMKHNRHESSKAAPQRGRRYSFSLGDDEVLPVSPSSSTFQQSPEAGSKGSVKSTCPLTVQHGVDFGLRCPLSAVIPKGSPSKKGLASTSSMVDSRDSSLTSSGSTNSVVWIGGGSAGDEYSLDMANSGVRVLHYCDYSQDHAVATAPSSTDGSRRALEPEPGSRPEPAGDHQLGAYGLSNSLAYGYLSSSGGNTGSLHGARDAGDQSQSLSMRSSASVTPEHVTCLGTTATRGLASASPSPLSVATNASVESAIQSTVTRPSTAGSVSAARIAAGRPVARGSQGRSSNPARITPRDG
ncbi:hypothetical protein B0H66DRAFT_529760 [Apodospora peruviana]|uniref:Uncharacterized protein n=1 Tax=Apodospora peruviana TaxID=516989 RepID=A0AAE0IIT4_9PEZI|nr:hypothetical protein B0H66DRAFT_529760 [Apodospora peruviana]